MRFNSIVPFPVLFLFFFLPWLAQQDGVKVEHDLPERVAPGESKEVTLRVHKGDRGGFAKLELNIPDGFRVKAVEKSGASFTFEDGVAKFIWMAMPKGGQFLVKYRLIAKKKAKGERTISGDLRYIEENERKRTHIEERTVRIQKKAGKAEQNEADEGTQTAGDTGQGIKIRRKIKKVEERRFKVRLKLRKGTTKGFAKLVDRVPKGFDASPEESMEATFTFQDRKVKFVWMQMPRAKSFWVQYQLEAKKAKAGKYSIEGTFSFLREGNSIDKKIAPSRLEVSAPLAKKSSKDTAKAGQGNDDEASERTAEADSSMGSSEDSVQKASDEQEKSTATASGEGEEESPDSLTGDVPAPQKGIDFRVQICAGHDPVESDHFSRVYGYEGDYDIDHHEGWIKYLTGKFERYKKARDKRVHFRQNFDLPGPFVTAYNDGERITVQEALMVTDQEWVQ